MAYSEKLADRIRERLAELPVVEEKEEKVTHFQSLTPEVSDRIALHLLTKP
jgi:cell fate (sporulation/competence/biofilm development) regulator YmcA (YheA/YmcA/DUF963 family)